MKVISDLDNHLKKGKALILDLEKEPISYLKELDILTASKNASVVGSWLLTVSEITNVLTFVYVLQDLSTEFNRV